MKLSNRQINSIVEEIIEQIKDKRNKAHDEELKELKSKELPSYIRELIEASNNYSEALSDARKILGGNFCGYYNSGVERETIIDAYYEQILKKNNSNLSYDKIKRDLTIRTVDPELDIANYIKEVVKSY